MTQEDPQAGFLPIVPEGLPEGWVSRAPEEADVEEIVGLVLAEKLEVEGSGTVQADVIAGEAVGQGAWTRREVVVLDAEGRIRVWARVHDRAAGRTNVDLTADPGLSREQEQHLAGILLDWAEQVALNISRGRGLGGTRLDVSVHENDDRLRSMLAPDGYHLARTWLQMTRDRRPGDEDLVETHQREGVVVRRVAKREDGTPVAADLQSVYRMIEESFADHFNSYRESFPEFLARLREAPGHRWDHWWIADIDVEGQWVPGGAVAALVLPPDEDGVEGTYIDYIGVHRLARGRGVAKSLLHTVIADTARRDRNRLSLEVDADSPTGADGLYESMGWTTRYRTESWHRDVRLDGTDDPVPMARRDD
ncbi:GNAT family N-acetyltransferase [Janibacter cremeus]|uniref:GNAT superfamily N-acetyltransferase n=1 Tax=Janibacter cremeus TaxID=1285192 RepID=A0A852VY99_9MICO|nr:GNAT family N-acetyltransferase [Janibacter cremeus]NYF98481.1 GNAT superfamily N-acetyltransferase [Janibacter cremeus]